MIPPTLTEPRSVPAAPRAPIIYGCAPCLLLLLAMRTYQPGSVSPRWPPVPAPAGAEVPPKPSCMGLCGPYFCPYRLFGRSGKMLATEFAQGKRRRATDHSSAQRLTARFTIRAPLGDGRLPDQHENTLVANALDAVWVLVGDLFRAVWSNPDEFISESVGMTAQQLVQLENPGAQPPPAATQGELQRARDRVAGIQRAAHAAVFGVAGGSTDGSTGDDDYSDDGGDVATVGALGDDMPRVGDGPAADNNVPTRVPAMVPRVGRARRDVARAAAWAAGPLVHQGNVEHTSITPAPLARDIIDLTTDTLGLASFLAATIVVPEEATGADMRGMDVAGPSHGVAGGVGTINIEEEMAVQRRVADEVGEDPDNLRPDVVVRASMEQQQRRHQGASGSHTVGAVLGGVASVAGAAQAQRRRARAPEPDIDPNDVEAVAAAERRRKKGKGPAEE